MVLSFSFAKLDCLLYSLFEDLPLTYGQRRGTLRQNNRQKSCPPIADKCAIPQKLAE